MEQQLEENQLAAYISWDAMPWMPHATRNRASRDRMTRHRRVVVSQTPRQSDHMPASSVGHASSQTIVSSNNLCDRFSLPEHAHIVPSRLSGLFTLILNSTLCSVYLVWSSQLVQLLTNFSQLYIAASSSQQLLCGEVFQCNIHWLLDLCYLCMRLAWMDYQSEAKQLLLGIVFLLIILLQCL